MPSLSFFGSDVVDNAGNRLLDSWADASIGDPNVLVLPATWTEFLDTAPDATLSILNSENLVVGAVGGLPAESDTIPYTIDPATPGFGPRVWSVDVDCNTGSRLITFYTTEPCAFTGGGNDVKAYKSDVNFFMIRNLGAPGTTSVRGGRFGWSGGGELVEDFADITDNTFHLNAGAITGSESGTTNDGYTRGI